MKWILFVLYAAVNFLPANADAQANAAPKTYAIVIGISKYEDPSIPQLQFADKDARIFAAYLQSKAGGSLPAGQVKLLVNEQANIAGILSALKWLSNSCTENDIAYIFFSGHGDVETETIYNHGYLLAYNSPPNNYSQNAIRIEDVNDKANTLSVRNKSKVILITDACHSGKLAGDAFRGRELAAKELKLIRTNEVRLASCAPNELSAEGIQWGDGRGVFSYYLVRGLEGLADKEKNGSINLAELQKYIDSCFANDKNLAMENHQQHPVTEGDPLFLLAKVDAATAAKLNNKTSKDIATGLEKFEPAKLSNMDSFFISLANVPIESIIPFEIFTGLPKDSVAVSLLKNCIIKYREIDSLDKNLYEAVKFPGIATLQKILKTVSKKNDAALFNNSLAAFVHTKAQKMLNAYLTGDANEMARRQYYYTGREKYSEFLAMHKLGLSLLTPGDDLYTMMEMQQAYLSGLDARLQMPVAANKDSLSKIAFQFQYKALAIDESAAYVHNEFGLLFLYKKQFDSADYHFRFATDMAPTWALPWSNLIVLNLNTGNLQKATEAEKEAKKLQPNNDLLLCNEGVLMERQNNFLAAASFFLKAIAVNDKHFLPFGHLGQMYIEAGQYAKADSFLHEATKRLNLLYLPVGNASPLREAVNETERVGLGHHSSGDMYAGKKISEEFNLLLQGLKMYESEQFADAESVLKKAMQLSPGIPLANHYLALLLIKQSKWSEAEMYLKTAITSFREEQMLEIYLDDALGIHSDSDSNILVRYDIMDFSYSVLQDHYWLAKVYEKTMQQDKAIEAYHAIIKIENERALYPPADFRSKYRDQHPCPITGYIKLEKLLEGMGDYNQAEKELLEQFNFLKGICNSISFGSNSNFFINIYSIAAGEIFNFYERMQKQFPEQPDWYKKAGLFLFQRIEPAFKNMEPKKYAFFYNILSSNPFPWIKNRTSELSETFILPGTDDTINTIIPLINPVTKSLEYLKKTLQLWGTAEKPGDIVFDIAELNSWMGNKVEAMKWYAELLDMQPKNSIARNKYIQYLIFCNELPLAAEQLQILYNQSQARPDQQIQLANYQMLAGQYQKAESILKKYSAENKSASEKIMQSFASLYYLSGNYKKALQYLSDSLPEDKILAEDNEEIKLAKQEKNGCRLYSIARYTAVSGNIKKGIELLKTALQSGFAKYKYVLENDKAWDSMIKTKEWKKIIAQASYKDYRNIDEYDEPDFYTMISPYRF